MRSKVVQLFQTLPHPCGYFAERTAQNRVIDPSAPQLAQVYEQALEQGYRRAGGHVYQPHCTTCQACIACRIPVARFIPNRSQRRCFRRNTDLRVTVLPASYSDEYFALYQRYLKARHPHGGMDEAVPEDFLRFLYTSWSPTWFVEFRHLNQLVAVAVTDFFASGLSSVYTFFDPSEEHRGLGTYAVLRQIELARSHSLDYLYLGFWIKGHPKMDYKADFQPLDILRAGNWQALAFQDRQLPDS